MIQKQPISAPHVLNEAYQYEKPATFVRGTKISMGPFHLVVLSGTASVDEHGKSIHIGNFAAQVERTYKNITALLQASLMTWSDVIKLTVYLRDIDRDYEEFCVLRKTFFDSLKLPFYPASTCVEAKLCRPELLVEMETWALQDTSSMGEAESS